MANKDTGLTLTEVKKNREIYGTNDINVSNQNSFIKLLIESLGDPIIRILLIALGIKTVFLIKDFDWYETVGIVIAIFIASFVSSISEYGSEKAFSKLQEEYQKIKCKVIRDAHVHEINISDVVKGDLIVLESGDKIPADGVILSGKITVDESSLTGESIEKNKIISDKVFRGSVVYSGEALMTVLEVGKNTLYGKTALEVSEKSPISPLKLRLFRLAKQISIIGYVGAFLVASSYLFSVIVISNNFNISRIMEFISNFPVLFGHILYALTLAVTIIVVAVPEGLPMMITLVLSSNMKKMLKNNVLVRKLVGIETAGNLNILFTDKTGTLTKGKLEVIRIVSGDLIEYDNELELQDKYHDLVKDSIVYNNSSYIDDSKIVGGNSTDRALLNFIKTPYKSIKKVDVIPFDSKNKYMITTIEKDHKIKLIKGAPEVILDKCTYYYDKYGSKKRLVNKDKINSYIDNMTNKGIRVVVMAINDSYSVNPFKNLVLVGIALIKDEIREEAKVGIELMKKAHINTIMITGDNKKTAREIANELGMINDKSIIITSNELNNMSDNELREILPNLKVVARAFPQDKSRLVKIAQSMDLIVGMTGDGVNDAAALKKADVGFSMGSGCEVAKEASDIVINDDNFISITKAVLFGRTIFKSIRKFIIFQLTVNFCAISLSVLGPFIGINTPITVIQMLWVNMVMDTLAGLAFSYEPPILEYMDELPKSKNESIINKYMFNQITVMGIYSSLMCILFLKLPMIRNLFISNESFMTAFFGLFIFLGIFNSFNARTTRINLVANILKNKMFIFIICLIVIIQLLLIYFGGSIFRTIGLNLKELFIIIILSMSVIPVDWARKIIFKKNNELLL
ncbi:MAG: calcium-translocating P-type ATPase, PMCA-type [Bacilli bacterium]|nr:calcium-translocating P-type ATPase, PMCA-type [Bacilli bacterium]